MEHLYRNPSLPRITNRAKGILRPVLVWVLAIWGLGCSGNPPPGEPVGARAAEEPSGESIDQRAAAGVEEDIESRLAAEDFASAERASRAAIEQGFDGAPMQERLGRALFGLGRQAEAIEVFGRSINLDPERADAYIWLGRSLAERIDQVPILGRLPLAQRLHAAFLRAAELDPQRPAVHLALARFYSEAPSFAGGDAAKARAHVDILLQLDPPAGHRTLAGIFEGEEKLAKAEREYLAAIDTGPEDLESYHAAGDFFVRLGRIDRALEMFEAALRVDGNDTRSLLSIGRLTLQGQEPAAIRAEEALGRILEVPREQMLPSEAPRWSEASWWLGQLLERRGDLEGACRAYLEAARNPMPHPPAEDSLAALNTAHGGVCSAAKVEAQRLAQ